MPGQFGEETIGERITRLRAALARVRETLARAETNGQASNIGGAAAITEIAYERALNRQTQLEQEISQLEARLNGQPVRSALATTRLVLE